MLSCDSGKVKRLIEFVNQVETIVRGVDKRTGGGGDRDTQRGGKERQAKSISRSLFRDISNMPNPGSNRTNPSAASFSTPSVKSSSYEPVTGGFVTVPKGGGWTGRMKSREEIESAIDEETESMRKR